MPTAPLPVHLDRRDRTPLGRQLAGRIRELVLGGTLTQGDRLPSTRALAGDLGVARSVAEQAYEQLVAEGWLEGRRGAGTFVAPGRFDTHPPARSSTPTPTATSASTRVPAPGRTGADERSLVSLDAGTPWVDPRHEAGWRRAWREVAAARAPRGYQDPSGLPELRTALAEHLARHRGLAVDPAEVLVTSGTTDGLRHLLAALPPGPVGLEDPGYRAAVATVRAAGREVRDLPATDPARDLRGLAAAYLTPAHQHPLGRVMPASDRLTALAAARKAQAVLVEDDYDSELRYDVAPVPALASLDRSRVAYLGTASKSVSPALRLGWMVLPPGLRERVEEHRTLTHDAVSWPVQRAYLALLREGYVDSVVRTARRVYAERAPRVAAALSPYAEPAGPVAGMYSTWLLPEDRARRARTAAREAGFAVNLLSSYCRSARLSGLLVGFGGCTDTELDEALTALRRALET